MRNKIHKPLYTIAVALFVLSSCYEPNDACLDRFASNYDVTADNACEDCCTYPSLTFLFSHNWDDELVGAQDTLEDDFLNPFILGQLEYFISNVVLLDDNLNEIQVLDSIELSFGSGNEFFTKDFQHISLSKTSYTFGQVITEMDIASIRFTLGIIPANIIFDELDEDFVLYEFKDSLNTDGQYIPWQIALSRDTMDAVSMDVGGEIGGVFNFDLTKELDVAVGEAIAIPIDVDVQMLFEGIDVKLSSEADLVSILTFNMSSAFK